MTAPTQPLADILVANESCRRDTLNNTLDNLEIGKISATQAYNKLALDYMGAFSYIVGSLTAREKLNMPPLPAKELLQRVYDSYGVLPVQSIIDELKLEIK